MRRALLLTAALLVATAGSAAAQGLTVDFHDGRVTVDATAVPVRAILTEWGKVGGTRIVGAERISGAPLTVKLINVTEAQALETILRSVAGYMAAPRTTGVGSSMYDRILVMATTSAPAPAAASTARPGRQQPNAFNGTQRFVPPPRQVRQEQEEEPEMEEPDENPPSPPVFTFPQQSPNGFPNQPGQFQNAPPNSPVGIAVNPSNNPGSITINPATSGQPAGPVGVSTPGMMVNPPPATPPPTTSPTMIRPPGSGRRQQ